MFVPEWFWSLGGSCLHVTYFFGKHKLHTSSTVFKATKRNVGEVVACCCTLTVVVFFGNLLPKKVACKSGFIDAMMPKKPAFHSTSFERMWHLFCLLVCPPWALGTSCITSSKPVCSYTCFFVGSCRAPSCAYVGPMWDRCWASVEPGVHLLTTSSCKMSIYHPNLVGGIPTRSEKYESQLGWLFPIYGKIKKVPNHQPATYLHHCSLTSCFDNSPITVKPNQDSDRSWCILWVLVI